MGFLKKVLSHITNFEYRYPGAIFLGLIIILLAVSDLFFQTITHDLRYMWYSLYEEGGKALFHIFLGSREINIEAYYEPPTWILSIKHQIASVLGMYVLSSTITWKRAANAVSWFAIVQVLGIIKYALTSKLSIGNPENIFALSEQPMHLMLWLGPILVGLKNGHIDLKELIKSKGVDQAQKFPLLITRIFAILFIVSAFRLIDLSITRALFNGDRLSLWQAGSALSNELFRWPVIHGSVIILKQFMYHVYVEYQAVTDGLTSINLGAPCLGKGVLVVFSVIIVLMNTSWQHKLLCIIKGFIVLILFNIARQSLLFAFVYQFGSQSYNYQTWHDIYSGIIYFAVILLWWRCSSKQDESLKRS